MHECHPSDLFQDFPRRDSKLLERSARRAAYLFSHEFSGEPCTDDFDVLYSSRDLVEGGPGEHRAYATATAIYQRATNGASATSILDLLESWKGIVSGDASLSLRYDKSWLNPTFHLIWLKAYKLLRGGSKEEKWFQLLFSIPAMVYASPELNDLVPVFVAFASHSRFRSEDPPPYDSYVISDGYRPSLDNLRSYVSACARPFERSPESTEPAKAGETSKSLTQRRLKMYQNRRDADADATAVLLLATWPCKTPPKCSLDLNLYDVENFMSNVQRVFLSCYRNFKLKQHLTRVQDILNNVSSVSPFSPLLVRYTFDTSSIISSSISHSPTLEELLITKPAPSLRTKSAALPRYSDTDARGKPVSGSAPLNRLIATAEKKAENPFQRRYVSALRGSAEYFGSEMENLASSGGTQLPSAKTLLSRYASCKKNYTKGLDDIKRELGPKSQNEQALQQSGQWPRITAFALFQCLASNSEIELSHSWKRCLTTLALLTLELQRARRLLRLHSDNRQEELRRELENEGCDGWKANAHPDWLLIQLQGNFLVRRVQAEVANEMISPRSGENTAMQLNMGEGKSSVIVPIVVSVLANGQQLVRVIVPKALTVQMFQVLVDRLGGLANRRIYFLPFSRSIHLDHERVSVLRELMSECMEVRGILVVQPEHVLSLKLVSVEKQLPRMEEGPVAMLLLDFQRWLHSYSRDILDESDEILHVRYQLVYTIGAQQHMEGSPERWTTTEQVLGLVNKHASALREKFLLGVEYESGPSGSFPHLRIFHMDAGRQLVSWIVQDVINGLLPNFSFGQLRSNLRDAIRNFISCEDVSSAQAQLVKDYTRNTSLWGRLLLLRGLFASGILLFAFRERRWRVDYGLAPARTMLAVPYRAKDVPAQRAEFGHPDIAIILTCLSYYYGGLTEDQLRHSFDILLKQDDPSLDYDLWVRGCPDVPESLQSLSGVNIMSPEQWNKHLFPLFSRNQKTVDFYLSNVVFPKEAKEFPSKLSCSGWDLAEKKERVLTGFSGTNDGQYLLPLHIKQCDPSHQRGTNAKVLSYLLQPENKHYMCMSHENGERRTTQEFLEILVAQEPEIRVLLDVGAQMLDLRNSELAKAWLTLNEDASAAIYFNEDDELTVCTPDGRTQLLLSSPFAQQLDQCIIYLDDAHTRGTDIDFPVGFRAAVTLGPKVTKDRLAQGCMRMRKLGHGHSIMFFAPLEIDQRIRSLAGKGPTANIDTKDILHWAIRETCDEIQRWAPHWAQQGTDHASRYAVWNRFCNGPLTSEKLSEKWLQPEVKRLEDLYGPRDASKSALLSEPDIRKRCTELEVLSLRDVSMDEEQEREVIHEAERERQVERPPRVPPAIHSLQTDVIDFLTTGVIPKNSEAFCPVFMTLDTTSAVPEEARVWSPHVLATLDFRTTVNFSGGLDEYLRPVQWVVSAKGTGNDVLVILSPYEVDLLIPCIRWSNKVRLHLYTARVTKTMKPCDDLALHSIPSGPAWATPSASLIDQLNFFSGQLYLKDYKTYIRLCSFLCVYAPDLQDDNGIKVSGDGFIMPEDRPWQLQTINAFETSPVPFLRSLMSIRRKGMLFESTHMGRLLDGQLLSTDDFDD